MYEDIIGLPFVDGGRSADTGFDCWGLAREVYRRYGIDLPDYRISALNTKKISEQMAEDKPAWIKVSDPLPVPCLVVIQLSCDSWANHVGVHIGNGLFIHAYRNTGVVIDRLKRWRSSIVGFYVPRGG